MVMPLLCLFADADSNEMSFICILFTRWKMFPLHVTIIGRKFRHTITLYWHIHIVCLGQWLSYGLDDQWILFWFLTEARHFYFLQNVQICEAHVACCQWVPGATGQGIVHPVCEHFHSVWWLLISSPYTMVYGEELNLSHNEFPTEAPFLISQ